MDGDLPIHILCSNGGEVLGDGTDLLEAIQFSIIEDDPAVLRVTNALGQLPLHVACVKKPTEEKV